MSEIRAETFFTDNYEQTQKIGEEFARKIKNGGVVLLYGNLGAGKTTFVQGLAKGLGIEKRIISPTFVIVRTYEIHLKSQIPNPKNKEDFIYFYHIDLYRLEGKKHELEEIGLFDMMKNPKNILAIEWPEKMSSVLPENRWEIWFENIDENTREITIKEI